jgi:hypothetical protein
MCAVMAGHLPQAGGGGGGSVFGGGPSVGNNGPVYCGDRRNTKS